MQWQDISTAPRDGTDILVYEAPHIYIVSWFQNRRGGGWDQGEHIVDRPTHWMPLPEPPQEGK